MKIYRELKAFAGDLSVLIVEDDIALNEEIFSLAELFFKEVLRAYNGLEALEIYKSKRPDIVLSDITMPHMNGIELCKKIKLTNDEQNIIMLSAHGEVEYFVELIDIGVRQFVHKPFKDEDFLYRMLKVCEAVSLQKFYAKEALEVVAVPQERSEQKEKRALREDFQLFTHKKLPPKDFFTELKGDATSWNILSEDIATLIEIGEDFELYINQIYLGNLSGDLLFKMSFLLKKMHSILVQIEALRGMADLFFNLAEFIKNSDFDTLSKDKQHKFTMLEFIYDDISRFIQTVFVYKDTIDVHYLRDSLESSVQQLIGSLQESKMQEEELELF